MALCGLCTAGATGTTTLTPADIIAMRGGKDYVNVRTAKNAGGEIRGQIHRTM